MYSGRRLPKRSIIGTRVCAPWPDGIFYPGVIEGTKTKSNCEELYCVIFDDGYSKEFTDSGIVGPGFNTVCSFQLKFNQKVYITHGGREVSGYVQKHRRPMDEVFIKINDDSETLVQRKIDEVRLLESRKSARLQDHETDYLKLADMCPEPKKRAQSQEIEVPTSSRAHCKSGSHVIASSKTAGEEEASMDEVMAAMVLTSLSSSPCIRTPERKDSTEKAPLSPLNLDSYWNEAVSSSPSSSSGHFSWDSRSRGTPSPPHEPDTSSPSHGCINTPQNTPVDAGRSFDEGIDVENAYLLLEDSFPRKRKSSTRTLYKCTWPGCEKKLGSCGGMERHVRTMHLGPKVDGDINDHEEEFYYTEIETNVESVTDTFANMYTSSPPTLSHMDMARPPHEDPSLRRKTPPHEDPSLRRKTSLEMLQSNASKQASSPLSPTPMPSSAHSAQTFTWHQIPGSPTFTFSASPSKVALPFRQRSNSAPQRLHPASPKTHGTATSKTHQLAGPYPKKVRGETKKCRKVYGMENRDMWCTQCKWKKACVRFVD